MVGTPKGRDSKERVLCNFGCAHPEGYRKAIAKMKMAAKFGIPIVCFVDTPGAYPGIASEERDVLQAIADAMFVASTLPTPIVASSFGEARGRDRNLRWDRAAMLEFSYYSVISPEGCGDSLEERASIKTKRLKRSDLRPKTCSNSRLSTTSSRSRSAARIATIASWRCASSSIFALSFAN